MRLSGSARTRLGFVFVVLVGTAALYWSSPEKASLQSRPAGGPPQYQIYDVGVVQAGDSASQGFGVSPDGVAIGRSFRTNGAQAFTWTSAGGIVGLPNLSGRAFAVANDANTSGSVVGTAATTSFGSGRLPVIWQNGNVSQLPMPGGQSLGDAYGINSAGVAAGSVGSGLDQRGAIFEGSNGTIISQVTSSGCFFVSAFGINDPGRVVGYGWDPGNAARNVGMVYDIGSASAFEVGGLPGGSTNGAIAFGVSNAGHVVGSTMMNQGSGLPFIWTDAGGMIAIPLAAGTSQGSARAVNSAGWVVGQDSSAFSIPFLYDGTMTYRLQDLIPANSGWDLSMNTSSSALGISENNVIVGTGVHNGETRAYAMIPDVGPTPTPTPSPTPSPTRTPTPTPSPFPELDLTISQADSPDPVISGRPLTYTLVVTNSPAALGGFACPVVRFTYPSGVPVVFIRTTGTDGFVGTPDASGVTFSGGCLSSVNGTSTATLTVVLAPQQAGTLTSFGTNVVVDPANLIPENDESNNTAQTVTTTVAAAPRTDFDFDGDRRADISVFRPASSTWYLQQSTNGFSATNWGLSTDKIVPADYDRDGKTDIAVYRPSEGNWYVLRSSNGTFFALNFGISEDVPTPGYFDVDDGVEVAVYRPSTGTWWIRTSQGPTFSARFGTSEDRPVVGDWDGDGRSDLAVFRPSNGNWYYSTDLVDPSHNFITVPFGVSSDLITPADFDGDTKTDIAVYRPSNGVWYWLSSANASAFNATQFGTSEDIPAAADFDGDGTADISVFRPSSGVWYRLNSLNGGFAATQFGAEGDLPTPAAFRY